MRVVYLGTPDFAVKPLEKLLTLKEIEVVAVVTNVDKPVGRKRVLTAPPVKVFAESKGLKVYQYLSIKKEGVEDLKALNPDLMVTCAFGQILSQEILDIPKHGVFNIHASILPKYRGPAPVQYAVLNGDEKTGVTIMKTDIGVDTGDMILTETTDIKKEETAGELLERLSLVGAVAIEKAIRSLINGTIKYIPQNHDNATHTKMLNKENAKLSLLNTSEEVVNKIRAYNPSPIAYIDFRGEPLKIYSAKTVDASGEVGEVLASDKRLIIACGSGAIEILTLQKAGGKVMDARSFLLGNKISVKEKIGL